SDTRKSRPRAARRPGVIPPAPRVAASSPAPALGLGAFAVFTQILGGAGIFGPPARPVAVAPAPVVYAPPPPVVYAPPPVYVAPAPVYYAPPPAVVVAPRPVYVAPHPVVVYRSVPVHRHVGWGHGHR